MLPEGNPLLDYFMNGPDRPINKWVDYFDAYHRLLNEYRGKSITVLEIGVQNGGSAMMWRNYFGPQARIIGVDIDPACKQLETEGFEIWIGDQADPEFWRGFLEKNPSLDIILDDGGHTMDQQIHTLNALWPALSFGGLFLFEDVHTSYLPLWGGGPPRSPGTFIGRVKRMIDDMHAWYYAPLDKIKGNPSTQELGSITVFESVVGLQKKRKNAPIALNRGGGAGHVPNPEFMTHLDMRRALKIPDSGLGGTDEGS